LGRGFGWKCSGSLRRVQALGVRYYGFAALAGKR
jgi:hypothetical protein